MSPNSLSSQKILKVLCLHGYRQNDNIFRQKTGGLRRSLKNYAQFEFVNAPHVVPPDDGVPSKEENGTSLSDTGDTFGWWLFVKDKTSETIKCEGLEKSVELIEKTFEEKGPFDGILAFSQGATFAGILSILLQEKKLKAKFSFALIIAGAHSLWEPLSKYSENTINISSLHIIGEADQIIPRARSEKFLQCFVNAQHQTHPGGHYVPASAALKKVYCDFLKEQLSSENAEDEQSARDTKDNVLFIG